MDHTGTKKETSFSHFTLKYIYNVYCYIYGLRFYIPLKFRYFIHLIRFIYYFKSCLIMVTRICPSPRTH